VVQRGHRDLRGRAEHPFIVSGTRGGQGIAGGQGEGEQGDEGTFHGMYSGIAWVWSHGEPDLRVRELAFINGGY
jgi:hypothetical protein